MQEMHHQHAQGTRNHMNYDPAENENVIALVRQDDGNWKGFAQKFGKLVEVREAKPEDALVKLLTHGGD